MLNDPDRWKAAGAAIATGLIGLALWQLLALERPEPTERRLYLEMRIEHADETARQLARWADSTLQFGELCGPVDAPAKPAAEKSPATQAAEDRRNARDALEAEFGALALYSGREVNAAVSQFVEWERGSRGEDCRKRPAPAEVRAKAGNLIRALRAEVVPAEFAAR